ncbi:UNVERIFIED_CONTAM: protein LAZ11 [Sesamum radiatum]|uniref:Protein LAZ11 n=1 Tax=Sesamum radiatum TaxID=300843 RepID=A0AAW2KJ25_SESRA
MDRGQLTLIGSTVCVMLSLHFSIQLVSQHFMSWKKPKEQKAIIIIVLMAPLYAIDSYVGLLDIRGSETFFTFLDSIKECYEALVMAKFLALMYTYLNISISKNIVPDEIKGREIHHSFPMTLFQPHTVRLDHNNLKLLNWLSWTFTIILNVSVSLALYSLVVFYHVFAKELAPHKPLAKFCASKGFFFCFWQGILLDILVAMGIIKSTISGWTSSIFRKLSRMFVIVEMVFFSLLMQYAYSAEPYRTGSVAEKSDKKK